MRFEIWNSYFLILYLYDFVAHVLPSLKNHTQCFVGFIYGHIYLLASKPTYLAMNVTFPFNIYVFQSIPSPEVALQSIPL